MREACGARNTLMSRDLRRNDAHRRGPGRVSHNAHMLVLLRTGLCALLLVVVTALPARADLTAFAGLQSGDLRPTTGISAGLGMLLVGWEVEVARAVQQQRDGVPSVTTGTGSLYIQNPIPIAGVQFYAIAGAGLYRERLEPTHQQTDVHIALGGGAKFTLTGPLKLRVDYRTFRMRHARTSSPHRVYAGLTLAF